MESIKKFIYDINGYMLKISMLLIMLMMLVTVADVLGRLFFTQIAGVFELTRYALAVIVFTSLGWSQIHKVHIAIDLFVSRMPLSWRNIIEVLVYLTAVITFSLAFWQMFKYAGRLFSVNQVTPVLAIPIHPWVYVSAAGVLFFVLVLLWDLVGAVHKLSRRGDISEYSSPWGS